MHDVRLNHLKLTVGALAGAYVASLAGGTAALLGYDGWRIALVALGPAVAVCALVVVTRPDVVARAVRSHREISLYAVPTLVVVVMFSHEEWVLYREGVRAAMQTPGARMSLLWPIALLLSLYLGHASTALGWRHTNRDEPRHPTLTARRQSIYEDRRLCAGALVIGIAGFLTGFVVELDRPPTSLVELPLVLITLFLLIVGFRGLFGNRRSAVSIIPTEAGLEIRDNSTARLFWYAFDGYRRSERTITLYRRIPGIEYRIRRRYIDDEERLLDTLDRYIDRLDDTAHTRGHAASDT